jgi:hypothetical protein
MAIWYSAADPTAREVCPCCDYVSLAERGNYLICPVCFWEDDGLDVDELDEESGPNHITLREARDNFAMFGACDKLMVPNVCSVKERKRFQWRPRDV